MSEPRSVCYVSNADSRDISVLAIDAERGVPTLLQTVACGGIVMPLAVSPDRRFLYAALRNEPFTVLAYTIEADGRLSELGAAPLPDSMAYIATDASGRFLFAASYSGAKVSVSSIDGAGRPAAAHQVVDTPPKAHSIRAAAGNRHVYAAVLGADEMRQFRFDADTGRLEAIDPPALRLYPPGCGPRHWVSHPTLPVIYLLCELDGGIDVFDVDAARGTLASRARVSVLPVGFSAEPWAAEIRITPDGRFLYATERRSSTVAGFAVDPRDGTLRPIGHWATQAQPRGMAIDPSGRFVVIAGQQSHHVDVHRIEPRGGALESIGSWSVGRNPTWVEAVALR